MNTWVEMFSEFAELFGMKISTNDLFTRLYQKSLEAEPDCGGIVTVNYLAGECITHLDEGYPLVIRRAGSRMNLANFIRAQLYATFATLRIGFDLLAQENVEIDCIMGHGGVFKTPGVGQRYLAAACQTNVTCMDTAGEGGPYGMALLAAYMIQKQPEETLEDFLNQRVFAGTKTSTVEPEPEIVEGYSRFLASFADCLKMEQLAQQLF